MRVLLEAMRFAFACPPHRPRSRGRRVAIVGGGPAGLVIAGYLACKGFEIDIYERLPEAGGLLYFVIPEVRASSTRVKLGIDELRDVFGVRIYTGTRVVGGNVPRAEEDEFASREVDLEELIRDYDATVIATGTWRTRRLGIPGEGAGGYFTALDLLFKLKARRLGFDIGDESIARLFRGRVVVIGGGLMALDVAMEAIYEGALQVTIIYSGTARDAPAGLYAINALATRGVRFLELVKPVEIVVEGGVVKGVEIVKLSYPSRQPIPESRHMIEADVVVNAIDVEPTPPVENGYAGIKLLDDGRIAVDENHMTSRKGVFAAGDVVLGPSKLGYAIRDALATALSIERFLGGEAHG